MASRGTTTSAVRSQAWIITNNRLLAECDFCGACCLDCGLCITEMICMGCKYNYAAIAAFILLIKSPGVCMLKVKMGAVVLAAVLAGAFSPKVEAFNTPAIACNASNADQYAFTWMGNKKFEWYCDGSEWVFHLQYHCNQFGLNCIPL